MSRLYVWNVQTLVPSQFLTVVASSVTSAISLASGGPGSQTKVIKAERGPEVDAVEPAEGKGHPYR